jgi:hypothetical protein
MTKNRSHQWGRVHLMAAIGTGLVLSPLQSAEGPFSITYTHQMEEPGNLEIATKNVTGKPANGNRFLGAVTELEYGVKGWWTTGFYWDGQATNREGPLFTGYRWENRFRLLPREHWINPVLYFEFANINGADRSLLEIVGHDGQDDFSGPNSETRTERKRELEAKLILGSHYKGWTIAENFIAEKNIRHAPFEFGYAGGISRPLGLAARAERCNICPENFQVGVEMYGGLGTYAEFGLHETSHYLAPTIGWSSASGTTFKISPSFGLTDTSARLMIRFGVSYEIARFGQQAKAALHGMVRR